MAKEKDNRLSAMLVIKVRDRVVFKKNLEQFIRDNWKDIPVLSEINPDVSVIDITPE
jgi:hypothetical protein